MLKYKVSLPNMSTGSLALNIVSAEFQEDSVHYDVRDGNYGVTDVVIDDNIIEFTAKDIYGIQGGSHLIGHNRINVANIETLTSNIYEYNETLIVDSASKVNNTFRVNVKKELELKIQNIGIETRFNSIQFINNQWQILNTSKEWLKENGVFDSEDDRWIKTTNAAYGLNTDQVPFDDDEGNMEYRHSYVVFYYENNIWKNITLFDDNLEGCKVGETINFNSFHQYDETNRNAIQLDKEKIYYTKEQYIFFNCSPTHYFSTPNENYVTKEVDEKVVSELTACYRPIVESIDYPTVNLYYKTYDSGYYLTETIPMECHIDNDTQLSFNYDALDDETQSVFETKLFSNGISCDDDLDALTQYGNSGAFTVKRDNIMYNSDYVSYKIIFDSSTNTIQIPISQKFETDMYHNDALKTNFVDAAKANAINPIIDMEKDVYTPAIPTKVGNQINANYEDCFKMVFNLHFREHRDKKSTEEEWVCEKNSYWNGTRVIKYYKDADDKVITEDEYEKLSDEKKKEYSECDIVDLKGRVYHYTTSDNDEYKKRIEGKQDFFSYFGEKPNNESGDENYDGEKDYTINTEYAENRKKRNSLKEYQSDALSFLGFINDDIKYQKSKLKKSFLRLSFYDSDNIGNQNLLHTSTIFLDSGNLFAKYIKDIEMDNQYQIAGAKEVYDKSEYNTLSTDEQLSCRSYGYPTAVVGSSKDKTVQTTIYNKGGSKVDREPMRDKVITLNKNSKDKDAIYFGDNIEDLEDIRLSSQFVVTDKYTSSRSSEGFYFYTYKSNDNGVIPSDIYMKVEFCHAGYGRTIPFMMPYVREKEKETDHYKDRNSFIKTFDDICYDWSGIDYEKNKIEPKDEENVGYKAIRYLKYSYIKWKYRYDKKTQKHIYYLDPDTYGTSVVSSNGHGNNIILNLYEGKIS